MCQWLAQLALVCFTVGCGGKRVDSNAGFGDADAPDAAACQPGASVECSCVNGATGAKVCESGGTLGECTCESPDVGPPQCVPGTASACACENGSTGAQTCDANGHFGSCTCASGEGGTTPACIPGQSSGCTCATGFPGAQICQNNFTYGECVCVTPDGGTTEQALLAAVKTDIVGTWIGTVQNPWQPAFEATLVFEANGHYSAHSPDNTPVFYYDTNDDSPEKTYELIDFKANGEVWGEIQIYYGSASTGQDEIRHLSISADKQHLTFEVWHQLLYGPIEFTLTRQN